MLRRQRDRKLEAQPGPLARFLVNRWYLVLLAWALALVILKFASPGWDAVVRDGDLEYLPQDAPSQAGQRLLREAFPDDVSRSQMVIVLSGVNAFTAAEEALVNDVARRFSYLIAMAKLPSPLAEDVRRIIGDLDATSFGKGSEPDQIAKLAERFQQELPVHVIERLVHHFDAAVRFDESYAAAMDRLDATAKAPRMVKLLPVRAALQRAAGRPEAAADDLRLWLLSQPLATSGASAAIAGSARLYDYWSEIGGLIDEGYSWADPVLSSKLGGRRDDFRLLVLQLRSEFMAVDNLTVFEALSELIGQCKGALPAVADSELQIEITGTAAVGTDLLRASREAVRRSEWLTVAAVIGTLALIYRAPLLVFVPLAVIVVSLTASTAILAWLAGISMRPDHLLTDFLQVYSTTRVFLVVLIFGIGTDLTLFIIVRCREYFAAEAPSPSPEPLDGERQRWSETLMRGWQATLPAIVGSGVTTMIGLSMMAWADFGKFRYGGVAITIAIGVTLLGCLTLTIALLKLIGPAAFWPMQQTRQLSHMTAAAWAGVGGFITRHPGKLLASTLLVLGPLAVIGWQIRDRVTYDLMEELGEAATSRRGEQLVRERLPKTATAALTVCVVRPEPFPNDREAAAAVEQLREALYLPGVISVAALTDPLGEFDPGRPLGMARRNTWRRLVLQNHPLAVQKFTATRGPYAQRAARFEITTEFDAFDPGVAALLERIREDLTQSAEGQGFWSGSISGVSGTAAGIVDLQRVTKQDQTRVQTLVTLAVFTVLLVLTRRLELSVYLMATVLFSYFVTLAITYLAFGGQLAGIFGGSPPPAGGEALDWKVPLFLFVILVAVGQDYNIYLTTRYMEERRRFGVSAALRRSIAATGGIITSCGLIMFATFAAMYAGGLGGGVDEAALFPVPSLRGIRELGFALSLGILLDTFIIRTLLVPAYLMVRKPA